MNKRGKKNGYTLLEILVVLGIFAGLSILVFPSTILEGQESKIRTVAKQIESSLYVAQQNAYARKDNTSYGIALFTNKYTLFEGSALAGSTDSEEIILPTEMTMSQIILTGGGSELVFPAGSFKPSKSGYVRVSGAHTSFIVEINQEGLLQTYKQ